LSHAFRRDGIYRYRLFWWFPWGVTSWWKPRIFRGGDEWCNDSVVFVVPPFGALVIFWRPGRRRTMPCPEEWDHMGEDQRADYAPCGWLWAGRTRAGAHHHVMDGACEPAQRWLAAQGGTEEA
jgi:hypothetical protein